MLANSWSNLLSYAFPPFFASLQRGWPVAQLVRRWSPMPGVPGSVPAGGKNFKVFLKARLEAARLILIAPWWLTQPWFRSLCRCLT